MDGDTWFEIQARPFTGRENYYPSSIKFRRRGLSGEWDTYLFDPPGFADELQTLHGTLNGEAFLSDHDGFELTVTANTNGRANAVIWINGPWPFGVEGSIKFTCAIDQSYLPALWRAVRETFPLASGAQRRIGEPLQ